MKLGAEFIHSIFVELVFVSGIRTHQVKGDLDTVRRSMQRIWKQREKQIEKVLINTVDMYGSVKGIAGNAVGSVKALELPGGDDEKSAVE